MRGRGAVAPLLPLIAVVLLLLPGLLQAQGGAGDRNRARPYFDPPREATTVSFAALSIWTADLIGDAGRPAALYYGNADLNTRELADEQRAQLAAAPRLIVFGNVFDEWLIEEYRKVNPARPVIRLFEREDLDEAAFNGFAWLETERARAAIARLAEALRGIHPDRATQITENEKRLDAQILEADREAAALLGPYRGTVVYATVPGFEPFARRHGLEVGAVLTRDVSRPATAAEVRAFRDRLARHSGTPVVLRIPGELPVALARASNQVPMRIALVDPMESGDTSRGHFVTQLRRNARNLAMELRASREIAAAFTPVPPEEAALQDLEAEQEPAPEE